MVGAEFGYTREDNGLFSKRKEQRNSEEKGKRMSEKEQEMTSKKVRASRGRQFSGYT